MSCGSPQFDFSGRRVLVTGGGQGIGREIVRTFHKFKATVFVLERDEESLTSLREEFPPDQVTGILVDLSDWEQTRQVTRSILPIHHLVNNAAIAPLLPILEEHPDNIDRVISVNFKAAFNLIQVVGRGMIDHQVTEGTIVNIGSIGDSIAFDGTAMYSASKAAIGALTRGAALELGPHGIRVNYIRPSMVNTPIIQNLPEEQKKALVTKITSRTIVKRLLEPQEVANAVVYLSSSLSAMVTGTSVTVDAGMTAC